MTTNMLLRAPKWGSRTMIIGLLVLTILLLCAQSLSWTQPTFIPSMVSDDYFDVFASHAINNTVVLVPVNTGMLNWADNLLCSLAPTSFDTSRIVFWTLDEGAQTTLRAQGHATYYDASLFSTSLNENLAGFTRDYKRMMKERPKFFIKLLSAGFDVLMLDADTVFWRSPLDIVPQHRSAVDAVFATDAREFYQTHDAFRDEWRQGDRMPPICGGIFWMKSSKDTVALWTEMLEIFEMPGLKGWWRRLTFDSDQRGMDILLNDGRARIVEPLPGGITPEMLPPVVEDQARVNVQLLDQTLAVNGHLLKNRRETYDNNLAEYRAQGKERIVAHFNWAPKELPKKQGAKEYHMFFADDNGRCVEPAN